MSGAGEVRGQRGVFACVFVDTMSLDDLKKAIIREGVGKAGGILDLFVSILKKG